MFFWKFSSKFISLNCHVQQNASVYFLVKCKLITLGVVTEKCEAFF
jgi:hypothetical protein